jgi:hypothetical protein
MVTTKAHEVGSRYPTHSALNALKQHLQCEYAGALPNDEIARVVRYSVRRLYRSGLRGDSLVDATKRVTRQALMRRIAVGIRQP